MVVMLVAAGSDGSLGDPLVDTKLLMPYLAFGHPQIVQEVHMASRSVTWQHISLASIIRQEFHPVGLVHSSAGGICIVSSMWSCPCPGGRCGGACQRVCSSWCKVIIRVWSWSWSWQYLLIIVVVVAVSHVCACAYLLSRLVVTLRSSVTTRGCPSDTLDPTYLL